MRIFLPHLTNMTDTENMNMNVKMNEKQETTGERIVREAMEPDERQLAQITLNGGYVYDVSWLPDEESVRFETGVDRKGRPNYLWYPDSRTIGATLARVIGCQEEKILIWGIKVYSESGVTDALHYETRRFKQNTWHDYASEGYALQFEVQVRCHHDEGDVECSAESCGKGMTESAFRAQLAKEVARNESLESIKQYTSDAATEPDEEEDAKTEAGEDEAEKAAILAAAQAMWRRWAEEEPKPKPEPAPAPEPEAEADDEADDEAEAEAEAEAEDEAEADDEADDEAEEMALKEDAALDYIEERLRYLIIFLLGFVVAMWLVSLNEVYKTYTH